MVRNKEAQTRYNEERKRRRLEKVAAKCARQAARRAAREAAAAAAAREWKPPVITEADLLAFQSTHFGDETTPGDWFVDPQVALDYNPADDYVDDGLGYYADGVKRTLTDEQIEMFRHSELEQLAREERLARGSESDEDDLDIGAYVSEGRSRSPFSDVSSLEEDLMDATLLRIARSNKKSAQNAPAAPALPASYFGSTKDSKPNSAKRSGSADPKAARPKKKLRAGEIPYEERNKRKWEEHIVSVDPVKGTWMYESKTENRMLREMDDIKAENVELDY